MSRLDDAIDVCPLDSLRCKLSTHPQKNTLKEVRPAPSRLSFVAGAIYLSDL